MIQSTTTARATATPAARPALRSDILSISAAVLAGLTLLFVAGVSQSAALHGAAHDQRHAIAFPCH
jgi:cobalt transporter subunit CbtB